MKQNKGRPPVAAGKHKLRAGGDQATAIADAGTYLTMPIFMGENMESNTVMVDTGSNRLTLASSTCTTGCGGTTYDYSGQVGFTLGEAQTLSYLSMTLAGYAATDTICVINDATSCVAAAPIHVFDTITFTDTTTTSTAIGGILGLGYNTIGISDANTLFMNVLENVSLITAKKFGLLMDGSSSFIDIGVVSEARMKGANNLLTVPVIDTDQNFWLTEVKGIKFQNNEWSNGQIVTESSDRAFKMETYSAIIDSGSTYSYVPQPFYDWLIKQLSSDIDFVNLNGTDGMAQYLCDDRNNIPIVYFQLGDKWLPMVIASQTVAGSTDECTFGFVKNTNYLDDGVISADGGDQFWLLGQNFMDDFYIVHDQTNSEMSFVPGASSSKALSFEGGPAEITAADDYLVGWIIMFVLVAGAIGALIWSYFFVKRRQTISIWNNEGDPSKMSQPEKLVSDEEEEEEIGEFDSLRKKFKNFNRKLKAGKPVVEMSEDKQPILVVLL